MFGAATVLHICGFISNRFVATQASLVQVRGPLVMYN